MCALRSIAGIDRHDVAGNAARIAPRGEKDIGAGEVIGHQHGAQRIAGAEPVLDARIGELRPAVLAE
jgi:hypothetical protein